MLCPTKPRSYTLLEVRRADRRHTLFEFDHRFAKVALDALAYQLLIAIEFIPHIVQGSAVPVIAILGYWEYLIVGFHLQLQFLFNVWLDDLCKGGSQLVLAVGQKDDVISVFCAVQLQSFVYHVHKVTQGQIGEELRQVVADWQSVCAVYNLIKKPKQIFVFDFPSYNTFQNVVLYGRIELLDVDFQAI